MIVLFVLGPPGVGKTSAVRHLLEPNSVLVENPKWTVGNKVVAAGHYKGHAFDGADTVPYNGVHDALMYWENFFLDHKLTILDGDRFSYPNAREFFLSRAEMVCAVLLRADDDNLARRRHERGSHQNQSYQSWLKGRATKSERFYNIFNVGRIINANHGVASVVGDMKSFLKEKCNYVY